MVTIWDVNMKNIGGGSTRAGSSDLQWPRVTLTRVSRSMYTYKSNIPKTLMDKVTIEHWGNVPYPLSNGTTF